MSETINGIEYLEVAEAAELLNVKKATLYAYVSRGVLRSYRQKVGRRRLYRREDIEALRAVRRNDEPEREMQQHNDEASETEDDRVLRDVDLPKVESWAGEH